MCRLRCIDQNLKVAAWRWPATSTGLAGVPCQWFSQPYYIMFAETKRASSSCIAWNTTIKSMYRAQGTIRSSVLESACSRAQLARPCMTLRGPAGRPQISAELGWCICSMQAIETELSKCMHDTPTVHRAANWVPDLRRSSAASNSMFQHM